MVIRTGDRESRPFAHVRAGAEVFLGIFSFRPGAFHEGEPRVRSRLIHSETIRCIRKDVAPGGHIPGMAATASGFAKAGSYKRGGSLGGAGIASSSSGAGGARGQMKMMGSNQPGGYGGGGASTLAQQQVMNTSSSRGFASRAGGGGSHLSRSGSLGSMLLTKPEADPRNWFLSSQRKEYNLTGKTRKEKESFQSIPALPTLQFTPESTFGADPQAKVKAQMSGLDACFSDTVRHINDFYFRPYVRPDYTRSALVPDHEAKRQQQYGAKR
ncbi:unnamed protein product [Amoebophrya sp. A25]|nr:unnamed protein product [Amoebophrya sp. A25]|eukprot:GSA25T00000050001.1